ncbi:MAG: hypothetical protein IT566_15330 [Rhodospirillaceae bacterium]|nr:hypothetical protein [Rhodospirillaceae bacterium]
MMAKPISQAGKVALDDRDTLHTLALKFLPIQHPVLRRARMIKNSRLDSVIEMYRDREMGSGQLDVEKLPSELGPSLEPADFSMLRALVLLPSYDVYSLRVTLRDSGICVNDSEALRLSPIKMKELAAYMKNFTRPLLMQIYGEEGMKIETFEDVVALFRDPDIQKARHKLNIMAAKLGIDIERIPKFLEDYADIFMSLSYYRQCLDAVTPAVHEFFESLEDLRKNYQMRSNVQLMAACKDMQSTFSELLTSVTGRLESFDRNTKDMWNDLSADRFRKIETVVRTFHTMMGGILCALTVKMDHWVELFPNRRAGAPGRRADFILNEMRHGMTRIREIEKVGAKAQVA